MGTTPNPKPASEGIGRIKNFNVPVFHDALGTESPILYSASLTQLLVPISAGRLLISNTTDKVAAISQVYGAGATGTAVRGSGGTAQKVVSVTVTNGGSGYATPPAVAFTGGGGTGAAGTAVLTSGVVTSVTITNQGASYSSTPAVTFTAPTASDGVFSMPANTVIEFPCAGMNDAANYYPNAINIVPGSGGSSGDVSFCFFCLNPELES